MTDTIIEARDITRNFGDFQAVDKLNLKIKKGEVFGFLGPNGAGKTTSINMMVGLLRPTSGQVLINGQDLEDVKKGIIGICPQELVLWDFLTCKESLMLMGDMYEVPRDELKLRVEKLLDDLFLQDKANTVVNQLSGGMKRRLNLAMAVVHQPEIVVLDEPSEGLDPQSRRVLWNYIRHLRDEEGKTVILTTHLMDEADRLSDRIAIIDHGKLLRLDTPSNLKKEIGEGDVVEMKLSDPAKNEEVVDILALMDGVHSVVKVEDALNVRALDAVGKLPQIIDAVETTGVHVLDLSVRQNTLEDVFIDLTGTGLRE
ncbi:MULTISPECIES: ATP-binding cassette domain-containing protein [Methanobacterium]|uniref:ABC transporter ATP-binding protein n=1 Tax=Methanobacterium formicicum TaxID=2162 RepID=A0A090I6W1_METFO|nr:MULTISPECIES: ATP-binding cassette domain-containing protein [Methanobacterium]AIS31319.1 ABC transporter ATP-binding protein [Methanobacterium formicicum]KUK75279.1 MAG: Sulfate-transporting ATPase [Methanobacterium sp. 42_16]MBF4475557.1 ATP-binding cassette domain-containing protein [Methanobacterium formicicum]MDG3547836.1 ATP-binding cassette domain-containing protein [Methanobacterium formicicum]MDH2659805.1 ATP-binding cassette domain-containing protein [Methanobacterium formicicum]